LGPTRDAPSTATGPILRRSRASKSGVEVIPVDDRVFPGCEIISHKDHREGGSPIPAVLGLDSKGK
jgi:hypothetical protein